MRFLFVVLLVMCAGWATGQKYTISGQLSDAGSGEDLIGATVTVKELSGTGAVANVYGFYSLTLPAGNYTLVYSFIGYRDKEQSIVLDKDIKLDMELATGAQELQVVEITGEREDANVTSNEMSITKIDPKEIEKIPVLFGERDILKTIQLYPGIKTAGEGNTGFYVRGGGADQNLILLDEAPVYNASHLLGFFSVFNSDALKDIKLYKGNMPAEYGGRLSSVMDIKMKEGNSKKLAVSGGVGLIASKLTVEAPIVKDKGSFIVSGRRTYADLFLAFSNNESTRNSVLYFYDVNAKANYKLGENDRVFLSGYFGRDNFGFGDQFGFDWGNATGTLRWNHIYNKKLFGNTSLIYSDYDYAINIGEEEERFTIASSIKDINLKQSFDYYPNAKNKMKFGVNAIHHTFAPGEIDASEGSIIVASAIDNKYALETAAYVSNEQKINPRITVNYGLRYSNFSQLGADGDIWTFNKEGEITDTTYYGRNEIVATYHGLAPRLSGTYVLDEKSSVKASVGRSYQYLHLLTNSTTTSPTDVWMPTSNNITPQLSDQVAVGYFRNFKENSWEFSGEVYYKTMQNVIDYRTGAEVSLNPEVEGELIYGDGQAYGVELFLKKRKGDFTGWVSYTLSRSEKRFEELNENTWFPARQDRTHDISLVGMYNITDRLNVSGTFIYYTGDAVTFPSGKYFLDGQIVNYYTERNGYRMPDYHRLDIGITLLGKGYKEILNPETGEKEQVKKKFNSSWNLSVYNVYSRENAYSIDFRQSADNPMQTEAVQLSLFKIVPSISYNFNF